MRVAAKAAGLDAFPEHVEFSVQIEHSELFVLLNVEQNDLHN